MSKPSRKTVLMETEKHLLVKIPEHMLEAVQMLAKGSTAPQIASDVDIIAAADKSARDRCQLVLADVYNSLRLAYSQMQETTRLSRMISCKPSCLDKGVCRCGREFIIQERLKLNGVHDLLSSLLHPNQGFVGFVKGKAKHPSKCGPPDTRVCEECGHRRAHCGCLVFSHDIQVNSHGDVIVPEEEEDEEEFEISSPLATGNLMPDHRHRRRVTSPPSAPTSDTDT